MLHSHLFIRTCFRASNDSSFWPSSDFDPPLTTQHYFVIKCMFRYFLIKYLNINRLGKYISSSMININELYIYCTLLNKISDKMMFDFNVLGSGMLNRILCQTNSNSIIKEYRYTIPTSLIIYQLILQNIRFRSC